MAFDKKSLMVISASVAVGFLGDVIIYSLAESKGKKFGIHFPKGVELVKLLALGIVTGIIIDFAVNKLAYAVMSKEERELLALIDKEKDKIAEDVQKIVVGCQNEGMNNETRIADNKISTECAIRDLEKLKEIYPYLK